MGSEFYPQFLYRLPIDTLRGYVLLQAALCTSVGALLGVELVKERHDAAVAIQQKLEIGSPFKEPIYIFTSYFKEPL